ncbi:MAG: FIST N-terminal domain-containing protein [Myxococcota bacterium]
MLFHTAKHDPHRYLDGARKVVGNKARVIGGYAGGIITRDHLAYDGYQSAVAVLRSDTVKFETFAERGLNEVGEREVGRRLATQIRSRDYEGDPGLIYMYDSVKRFTESGGFDMNIGSYLVEGMTGPLQTWPSAAGIGMIGNIQFNPTHQFFDDQVLQQSALGVVAHGPGFRMDVEVLHGCKPASDYHTVTAADGNVVLEIDGKPALETIADMLGPDAGKGWEEYPLFITLGVNRGDKWGEYNEEEYANRLCMAIDKERKALVMFEPDLTPGTEVQLMRRSVDFGYIRNRAEKLAAKLEGRKPFFAMYIDCMGRAAAYCGSAQEEGAEIQAVFGSRMPMLGMYTGVEIGPVGDMPQQALDWSGVLCVYSEA